MEAAAAEGTARCTPESVVPEAAPVKEEEDSSADVMVADRRLALLPEKELSETCSEDVPAPPPPCRDSSVVEKPENPQEVICAVHEE